MKEVSYHVLFNLKKLLLYFLFPSSLTFCSVVLVVEHTIKWTVLFVTLLLFCCFLWLGLTYIIICFRIKWLCTKRYSLPTTMSNFMIQANLLLTFDTYLSHSHTWEAVSELVFSFLRSCNYKDGYRHITECSITSHLSKMIFKFQNMQSFS